MLGYLARSSVGTPAPTSGSLRKVMKLSDPRASPCGCEQYVEKRCCHIELHWVREHMFDCKPTLGCATFAWGAPTISIHIIFIAGSILQSGVAVSTRVLAFTWGQPSHAKVTYAMWAYVACGKPMLVGMQLRPFLAESTTTI